MTSAATPHEAGPLAEPAADDVVDYTVTPNGNGDRLDFIRTRRKQLAQKRTLTLLVPGYGGHVAVRYKALPRDEIGSWVNKLIEREASVNDNIDLLIRCCDSIVIRQEGEAGLWEPFDLEQDPTTFSTGNLAEKLGEHADSARDEVKALFSPEGNQPLGPELHAEPLINWQRDVDYQVDRALLGE